MILSSSIDYLSYQGLPWVLAAWAGLYLFRPFATLVHESGHFAVAFLLTKGPLLLLVGKAGQSPLYEGHRVRFGFSFRNGQVGQTTYCTDEAGRSARILILLGGPLISLGMSCLTYWLTLRAGHPVWLEVLGISWFCANALAFLRATLPMRLRPSKDFPEGPPSDGLQLLWLLSGKKGEKKAGPTN